MLLCTFERPDGHTVPGMVAGDRMVDLARAFDDGGPPLEDLGDLAARLPLPCLRERLEALDAAREPSFARGEVRLRAPVARPPKVIAAGLNYRAHAAEQGGKPPERPILFAKARTAVTGPGDPIRLPPGGLPMVDPEVELAVVFGRNAFGLSQATAASAILGYTVADDVSDRDAQRSDKQWYRAKSRPTFCPTGPFVRAFDLDPADIPIRLSVNGEVRQSSRTSDMFFPVPALVEHLTSFQPVEPGDLLLTGTPAGVGLFRTPPVFLKPGDVVCCEIDGIGAIENRVVLGGGPYPGSGE